MKLTFVITFFVTVFQIAGHTQQSTEYVKLVAEANDFYKTKDFKKSAATFSKAFESNGWKGVVTDRYNAACSWALAGVPDSAFFQLNRIATKGNYSNYSHAIQDQDLISLHNDSRWNLFLEFVKRNKEKNEEGLDRILLALLDSMETLDQKWRHAVTNLRNEGAQPGDSRMLEAWKQTSLTDSLNYFVLNRIFSRYGFPNQDIVGSNGARKFWLLVQHQDRHPEFQEAVLEKMKIEADKGKASKLDYAYLVDRVKVNTGQLQVYGTQMRVNEAKTSFEPQPVVDPANLDSRRASVGLEPIEDYTKTMNTHYSGSLKKE
jgi:hypothetical protein